MNNVVFNQTDKMKIWGSATEEEKFEYLLNAPNIMKILSLIKVNLISLEEVYQQQYDTYICAFTVTLECNGKILVIKKEESLNPYAWKQEKVKKYHTHTSINDTSNTLDYMKEIFGNQDEDSYYGEMYIMRNIEELEKKYIYEQKLMTREFERAVIINEIHDLPY